MNFDQICKFTPQLLNIARKHGITKIYVFGSVVRGKTSKHSDVDFLVEMQDGASLFGIAGFGYETEKLLGVHVDVVPASLLPQLHDRVFVRNIEKDAVLL